MMRTLFLFALLSSLWGCASRPEQPIQYFVLDSPAKSRSDSHTAVQGQRKVVMQPIRIARYLTQGNLAMRLGSNEVYYSRQHLWAEDLDSAFQRAMVTSLNRSAPPHTYYLAAHEPGSDEAETSIEVRVDHFEATDESQAILVGEYWIISKKNGQLMKNSTFKLKRMLEIDGYAHAVSQLRNLIDDLVERINEETPGSDQ